MRLFVKAAHFKSCNNNGNCNGNGGVEGQGQEQKQRQILQPRKQHKAYPKHALILDVDGVMLLEEYFRNILV